MEIMLKNKCCLYVIISIRFLSIMICNLLIAFPSYICIYYSYLPAFSSIRNLRMQLASVIVANLPVINIIKYWPL